MKTRSVSKEKGHRGKGRLPLADPVTEHTNAARAAQAAIQNDSASPENYAALAGALRMLAQSLRDQNAEGADHLLHLACAAAWEAKSRSGQGLISGRTKQEVKVLIAWLRTRNHLTPEASETLMGQIHSEYLGRALDSTHSLHEATV